MSPSISKRRGCARPERRRSFKAVLLQLALEGAGLVPAALSDIPENNEAVEFALAATRQLIEYEQIG